MASLPPQKRTARIHNNVNLNRRLQFPTAQSTSKHQKTSVNRTLEAQLEGNFDNNSTIGMGGAQIQNASLNFKNQGLNHLLGSSTIPMKSFETLAQYKNSSLENSQERRFNLNLHSSLEEPFRKSNEKLHLMNHDYNFMIGGQPPSMPINSGFATAHSMNGSSLSNQITPGLTGQIPHSHMNMPMPPITINQHNTTLINVSSGTTNFSNAGDLLSQNQSSSLKKMNMMGSRGLIIPASNGAPLTQNQRDLIQQYSSIPVTRSRKETLNALNQSFNIQSSSHKQNLQFKSFQRQTQALMKMYGNNNVSNSLSNGRKYVKSVERRAPLDQSILASTVNQSAVVNPSSHPLNSGSSGAINLSAGKHRNLLKYQYNNSILSNSNSKLSNSYQMNPLLGSEYIRKFSGCNLNNSILNAINIYDSVHNSTASNESVRFKSGPRRNLQSSQNTKYQLLQQNMDKNPRGNSYGKKVSLKNFKGRYNNLVQPSSLQPTGEDFRVAFQMGSAQAITANNSILNLSSEVNSSKNLFHPNQATNLQQNMHQVDKSGVKSSSNNANLFIEQNDAYTDTSEINSAKRDSPGKRLGSKFHSHTNQNIKASRSSRRIPFKQSQRVQNMVDQSIQYLQMHTSVNNTNLNNSLDNSLQNISQIGIAPMTASRDNSLTQVPAQYSHTQLQTISPLIQGGQHFQLVQGINQHQTIPNFSMNQGIAGGQSKSSISVLSDRQPHVPSSQHILLQNFQNHPQFHINSSTTTNKSTTDAVMFQKQQELITSSQALFEEGKYKLMAREYKDALKTFSQALKLNPANRDAKYYRAIGYLDNQNPKKCVQELSELIQSEPLYNKSVYIVLSIAHRRLDDLPAAAKALSRGLQKFPKYVEAYQARGQISILMKKFDKALLDFQAVVKLQPNNGAGYVGQADSLKGLGNFKAALASYNKAVATDKDSQLLALTKRGILHYQLKNFDQALADFNLILEVNDKNARAHYYKGKVLKNKGLENEAILHFEQVIKISTQGTNHLPNSQFSTLEGKHQNELAIRSLNNNKRGQQENEQLPGYVCDDQLCGNALFENAKIRIKQKDFYEAFHNLQRAVHYDFQSHKFIHYKMFVEGVLLIMKRKVKKGIKILNQIIEGQITFDAKEGMNSSLPATTENTSKANFAQNISSIMTSLKDQGSKEQLSTIKPYLIYLIYCYRSYGYIMTQQLDKALSDLNKASKIRKLEQASVYNKYIAQALLKIDKRDLMGVRSILSQAEEKFPNNKDPYKFQAICIVQSCISEIVDVDNPKKRDKMLEAKSVIDRALVKNPKDPNLLYLRGLILYYLHQFYEALIDLDASIDLDEEPSAKLYLARGRCHACLSMFQEAITDLTKAIEMDEEISDSYFNRGKCAYLLGDTALAFLDFQKLILLEPKNPMVHIYAGNLLMTTGSYDDATKAFTNADSVQKSSLAFYQRSRCHIALANLDQALKDLCLVVERTPSDKIACVDKECLQALKNAIQASSISQAPLNQQASCPPSKSGYDASVFQKGVVVYTKLLNTHYDVEHNIANTTSASRMHQQIIPNVKRIKIEKMRALRRKRAKDGNSNGLKKTKKIRHRFFIEDEADAQLQAQAQQVEPFSYYKENIFGQEDFYLYRGVMNMYSGEYSKAISDFQMSIKVKQDQKDQENNSSGDNAETQSQSSSQTDLSDVGLCSLNVHESAYNIILCLILSKEYSQAVERISKLITDVPNKYKKHLILIRGLLYSALGNQSKSKPDLEQFQSADASTYQEIFEAKSVPTINPFPLNSRICTLFPELKFSIPSSLPSEQLTKTIYHFYSRPSFSFPFVKPPNMIPNVDESVLQQEFDLKNVAPPKPEAPWIKRCDFGIKFTDEIQVVDESTALLTETEPSMMVVNDDHRDQRNDEEASEYNHHGYQEQQNHQDYGINRHKDQQEITNERYYLRNYVKEQRAMTVKAMSEQLFKGNEFNFFREEMDEMHLKNQDHQLNQEDDEDEAYNYEDEEEEYEQDEEEVSIEERKSSKGMHQVLKDKGVKVKDTAVMVREEGHENDTNRNIQAQLLHHLYAETDIQDQHGHKNIILDQQIDIEEEDNDSTR